MRRFTRHSRRRRITWLSVAGVFAGLAVVLGIAVYSPILALREITIVGASRVDDTQLHAALDGQLGTPLALLDFGRIRSELAAFPLIRSYVTETVPPDALIIHLVERQPIGSIARGKFYDQVDPAGVVVSTSDKKTKLPVIDVGSNGVDSATFDSVVEVLLAMPAPVREKVETISATTPDDVRLGLSGDVPDVVWGSARDSQLKGEVLGQMLKQPECADLAVIDVSAALAVVCGPK